MYIATHAVMYACMLIDEEYRDILPLGELFEGSFNGWYVRLCRHRHTLKLVT